MDTGLLKNDYSMALSSSDDSSDVPDDAFDDGNGNVGNDGGISWS